MKKFSTIAAYYNFLNSIPDDKWKILGSINEEGQMCVLSHLTYPESWTKEKHLSQLMRNGNFCFYEVNDGNCRDGINYMKLGKTPKERVLNALVMKAAGIWEIAHGE